MKQILIVEDDITMNRMLSNIFVYLLGMVVLFIAPFKEKK